MTLLGTRLAGSCRTMQSEMIEQEDENFLRSRQDLFTFVKGLSFTGFHYRNDVFVLWVFLFQQGMLMQGSRVEWSADMAGSSCLADNHNPCDEV